VFSKICVLLSHLPGHFVGVLDYILFTKSNLATVSCLEVNTEETLKKNVALPSPVFSSDHVSLVAELDFLD